MSLEKTSLALFLKWIIFLFVRAILYARTLAYGQFCPYGSYLVAYSKVIQMSLIHNSIVASVSEHIQNTIGSILGKKTHETSQYIDSICQNCHVHTEDTEIRIQQIDEIDRLVDEIKQMGIDAQVQHICNSCLKELNTKHMLQITELDRFHPVNHIFILKKDKNSSPVYSLVEDIRDFKCILVLLKKQAKQPIDERYYSALNDLKLYSTRKRIKSYCGQTMSWRDFFGQMAAKIPNH